MAKKRERRKHPFIPEAVGVQAREVELLKEAQCYLAHASEKLKQTKPQNEYDNDQRTYVIKRVREAFVEIFLLIAERGAGSKINSHYDKVHRPSHDAAMEQVCNHAHDEEARCTVDAEKFHRLCKSRQQTVREALTVHKSDGVELNQFEEEVLAAKTAVQ